MVFENHLQEWVQGSGVAESVAHLNLRSIDGPEIFELLYPVVERRNSGVLTDAYLRRYARCESASGWQVRGVDPITGELSDYQRFKQTDGDPIVYDSKKQKAAKYLTPKGVATQPIFLAVPDELWDRFCEKYAKPRGESQHFWEWVLQNRIPIALTEGEKKAACLLSRLVVAIALPGINAGYRTQGFKKGKRHLVPQLQLFDDGREITITFDYREGDYFQSPEWKATRNLGFCFQKSQVKITRLPGPEKGIDDWLVAGGDLNNLLEGAKPIWKLHQEHLWRCYKAFTPTLRINQQYFTLHQTDKKLILGKSGLGTGKTRAIRDEVAFNPKGKVFDLGYRNGLLLQHSDEWNLNHLHEHDGFKLLLDPNVRLSLCLDSILHIPDDAFEGATLILDEVNSVIKHLLTSKTINHIRNQIIAKFTLALRKASKIIALDGTLNNDVKKYLEALTGERSYSVENEFKGNNPPVYFLNDYQSFIREIIRTDTPLSIAVDSRVEAEALDKLLTKLGKKGLLISSKTVGKKGVRDFLKNPDQWVKDNQPDYLIYTPTAESGLNVSTPDYFTDVYVSGNGVVGCDELYQMSRRVRYVQRIVIHCKEKGLGKNTANWHSQLVDALSERIGAEAALLNDEEIKQAIIEEASNPSLIMRAKLDARANLERQNLRAFLKLTYQDAGFEVAEITSEALPHDEENIQELKEEVRLQECLDIFNAPTISLEQAKQMERSFVAEWDKQCQIIKAKLLARLPGVETATFVDDNGVERSLWSLEFIYLIRFEERSLINNLEFAWLYRNPEAAEKLQQHNWRNRGDVFWPDWNDAFIKAKVLKNLGFDKFLDSSLRWHKDNSEVQEFIAAASRKSASRILGKPGKYAMRYIKGLLEEFGLSFRSRQVRRDGRVVREYQVGSPINPMVLALSSVIEQKMVKKSTWLDSPQTQTEQGFRSVTDSPENYINQAPSVTPPTSQREVEQEGADPWMETESINEVAGWLSLASDRHTFDAILSLGISFGALQTAMARLARDTRERCLGWLGWGPDWQHFGSA